MNDFEKDNYIQQIEEVLGLLKKEERVPFDKKLFKNKWDEKLEHLVYSNELDFISFKTVVNFKRVARKISKLSWRANKGFLLICKNQDYYSACCQPKDIKKDDLKKYLLVMDKNLVKNFSLHRKRVVEGRLDKGLGYFFNAIYLKSSDQEVNRKAYLDYCIKVFKVKKHKKVEEKRRIFDEKEKERKKKYIVNFNKVNDVAFQKAKENILKCNLITPRDKEILEEVENYYDFFEEKWRLKKIDQEMLKLAASPLTFTTFEFKDRYIHINYYLWS